MQRRVRRRKGSKRMKEYEVLDLLRLLIKKWYIIVMFICLFAVSSIPLAKKSYNDAVSYYNTQINTLTYEEELIQQESYSLFCILKAEEVGVSEISGEEAAKVVYELLCDSAVRNCINNKLKIGVTDSFEDVLGKSSIKLLGNSNLILFSSTSLGETEFESLLVQVENVLSEDMKDIFGQQLKIEFGNVTSELLTLQQTMSEDKSFANAALKQPSERDSYIKTMITASAMGFMLGVSYILVKEYISINYKERKSKEI